ncbi:aminopeptidase P family protein [Cardinium endosymbiont of Culicoides punctatus]|uniref:aminopeptidase P family protein n=1 Tax=Cardinium endosymbiont of Culicoides punctatus TaxID=2304601 RepID=UPI0010590424|nr:aminopeptidase P family protein [Cardinium endosymbiont of Culicoides punctatus]TDG95669.1 Xaa-Pro aminopeptidase [Cardinium endosymbiont of Culicoides punctatus]
MRYKTIDKHLFIKNRQKLLTHMRPNSLVVLHANDILPKNTDSTMPFVQNSDLFYCSGIDQEETILLLYPDAIRQEWKEILFIKETGAMLAIWEGNKYSKQEARDISGIENVCWTSQFESTFNVLMGLVEYVYLNTNEHIRAACTVETRDRRFIHWCKQRYPLHCYGRIAPIMQQLRGIKEKGEIALIQEACNITEAGFRAILPHIRPGLMEYEIEGLLSYAFLSRGSRGFAYAPIIASGANSCILHYTNNDQPCQSGGVLLLDIGAEYANYSADLTRVVPIDGRFTTRQREVYNSVLRILKTTQEILRPGLSFADYHKEVIAMVEHELCTLNLIDRTDIKNQTQEVPAYKRYFMHGISHHLGLSTHDLGDTYDMVLPQMVFTVEPGIYIREEGIGIRLENNIAITHDGIQNLMQHIPIEAEEIEELMH